MSLLKYSICSRGMSPQPVFAACLCSNCLPEMTQGLCQEPELWRSPGWFWQPPLPSLGSLRRRSVQTPMPAGQLQSSSPAVAVDTAEDGSPHPTATSQPRGGSVSLYLDVVERIPLQNTNFSCEFGPWFWSWVYFLVIEYAWGRLLLLFKRFLFAYNTRTYLLIFLSLL